ncbi:immunity 52 family protein [Ornithinimicrobium cryptoxanthini]|uniref:Immunity 52 family protein n=1 Tax=Ornithinimicrobium cryptoxanthini TaxID=2934161 RepID=A0ABY4YLB3_9MICO|nr:immunity 52 family protein [Ornithinimicrobium cryptoxanthini]USQ77474.1 immunity 52 family protein [Ornithinimicrobium cryptoxanthini]
MTVDQSLGRPYIGAYWGQRRESAWAGAERLLRCVTLLGEAHSLLGSWFRGGSTRDAAWAGPLAGDDLEAVTQRFERGALRRDDNGEPMPYGGFVVGWWNGEAAAPAGLRASAGIESEFQVNSVVLELPPLENAEHIYQPEAAVQILTAIQSSWELEWATWVTHPWRDARPLSRPWPPSMGWLTYLNGVQPHALDAGHMEGVADGALVWAADAFSRVTVDGLLAVRAGLERAGDLRPVLR